MIMGVLVGACNALHFRLRMPKGVSTYYMYSNSQLWLSPEAWNNIAERGEKKIRHQRFGDNEEMSASAGTWNFVYLPNAGISSGVKRRAKAKIEAH